MRGMRKTVWLLAAILCARVAGAQVLTTEVWVGDLDMREGRFAVSNLKNISNHPGYDNQPSFYADGESLLYTAEAESVAETGLGVHAVRYWMRSGESRPMTKTRGFSPTPVPEGILTLREGTVWLHDAEGNPQRSLLPLVKTAGYFARMDDERWVLFMNEQDRRIAIWDQRTYSLAKPVPNAITAPYRIPGTMGVTFVVQEGEAKRLMRLDLTDDRGSLDRELAKIPFRTGGHHVWTSRGTILMASGNVIYEWGIDKPWTEVARLDSPDLQGITRIALSPREDRIALVSVPNDRVVLEEARAASNRTLAESLAAHRATSYVRTLAALEMAGEAATERGTWVRRWRSRGVPVELQGDYEVTWRRTVSGNGTPVWRVAAERYTSR
jgi:hypothetical protein